MSVKVRYKDYNYVTGEIKVDERIYKSWNEDGGYTIFYGGDSLDTARFIIPTRNVIWIEIVKD